MKESLFENQNLTHVISICVSGLFVIFVAVGYAYYNTRLKISNALLKREKEKNEKLMVERDNLDSQIDLLRMEISNMKCVSLQDSNMDAGVQDVVKSRIKTLNDILATLLSESGDGDELYIKLRKMVVSNKEAFLNTTFDTFKAVSPKFINFFANQGLSRTEMDYVCLYALGLRGKDVGEFMKNKRHYHISSDIRKKLDIDEHQTNLGIYIRNKLTELWR